MQIPKIGLAIAAVAAVTLAVPATASAAPQTRAAPRVSSAAHQLTRHPTTNGVHCKPGQAPGTTRCTGFTWIHWKDLPASQQAARQRIMAAHARPASIPTEPSQCEFGNEVPPVSVYPDRFTSCWDDLGLVENQTCVDGTCTITGTFTIEDQQWVLFSKTDKQWTHGMITIGLGGTGDLTAGVVGTVGSNCTTPIGHPGPCDAEGIDGTSNPDTVTIEDGSRLGFMWSEADTGPAAIEAGQIDVFDSILGVAWAFDNAMSTATDVGGLAGRCDSVYSSTPGCVDEQFIPTLFLPRSVYGASAAMIQWAQQNLRADWGDPNGGTPLQRLTDDNQAEANRKVICDSTFKNMGSFFGGDFGDSDSCDEFPFASTYQSGANAVTSGSQCAQVSAVETGTPGQTEAQRWNSVKVDGTFSPLAQCVRGHIPNKLNGMVGTAYSTLITTYRLIDKDYFWAIVT